MTKKQEPTALLTIERKVTIRLTHELVEQILREAVKAPASAYFGCGDYTPSDYVFEWHEQEPLADLKSLDAIKGNPILTDVQWTPEELAAMRAPVNAEPVKHLRDRKP